MGMKHDVLCDISLFLNTGLHTKEETCAKLKQATFIDDPSPCYDRSDFVSNTMLNDQDNMSM